MGVLMWGVGVGCRSGCRMHIQDVNGQHSAGAEYPCSAQCAGLDCGVQMEGMGTSTGCRMEDATWGVGSGIQV